ncbi:serine/threonine-protein kinase [Streptomyces sp. So13.3]|uniref:serine/threonine-protein kinase n=1 Tax=Streptomyces sp. So13.3 TaxID=2136173 RepID=UPI001FD62D94|nr:serine/threonine-protein kinase [Streptomyces sp. So13.3]
MSDAGDVIDGRFELLERLGAGGMGTVWRARDMILHRQVALKEVLTADLPATDPVLRERVLREARALARLSHPHVVTIHQVVEEGPYPWLVMELVPGPSLQEVIATAPLLPHIAAGIGRNLLAALRAAHAVGIHHRDVKPANVLLRTDGQAVLTDFGIAAVQDATALTLTGHLIGTPEYMAPERIRGEEGNPASDLWSLGMLLYVAVEGVSPMRRPNTLATLAAVLDEPVPRPLRAGPLGPVLAELLSKDAGMRPDASRLDAMLADAVAATPSSVLTHSPTQLDSPRPVPASRRKRPEVLAVGAVIVIAALVSVLVFALRNGGPERTEGQAPPASLTTSASAAPNKSETHATTTTPTLPTLPTLPTSVAAPERTTDPLPTTATADNRPAGEDSADTWIAQLWSEPIVSEPVARDRQLTIVRRQVPEAIVLRSDDFASLRAGYWVVYAPGPYADGSAAVAFCAERGRTTPNQCVGRYLSHRAADIVYICRPAGGGTTAGACRRP